MIDIGTLTGMLTLEDTASASLKSFSSNLGNVASSLTAAGSALSIGVTAPLVAAAGASLMLSANFEASMTRLVSLAGVTADEIDGVKAAILDLAPASGIGPQALADAMTKISSTVSDSKLAMDLLTASAHGSAAGMGSALDVAGALTAVVNSYGKENITASRAADILTQAVKDGGAEAKELAPTLANVVPLAAQMGINFEQVGANIATLTKLGVPATEAVTQLSSIMTAMLKETDKGKDSLASVGLSYGELRKEIKDRGLAAALTDLSQRFGENKVGLAEVFGRTEALRNIMGTAGQQAETYATVLDNITRSSEGLGVATDTFNAMQETQIQNWAEVSASLQVAAIKFGDALAPAMKSVLDAAQPLLAAIISAADWFAKLPQPIQTGAIALGALAAAAGPVLLLIGGMASGISALVPVFALASSGVVSLGGAIRALAPALSVLGPAIAIVATGFAAWKLGGVIGEVTGLTDWVGKKLAGAFYGVSASQYEASRSATEVTSTHKGVVEITKAAEVATKAHTVATGMHIVKTEEQLEQLKKQKEALEKHKEALDAVNLKIADATRDTGNLTDKQELAVLSYTALGLSVSDISTKLGISEIAIKDYKEEVEDLTTKMLKSREETVKFQLSFTGMKWNVVREDVTLLKSTIGEFHGGLTVMGDEIRTVTIPMFAALPPVISGMKHEIGEAKEVTSDFHDVIVGIPDLLMKAFTGGGGLKGAINALGVQVSSAIIGPIKQGMTDIEKKIISTKQSAVAMGSSLAGALGQQAGLGSTAQSVLGIATGLGGAAIAATGWGTSMAAAGIAGTVALSAATLGIGAAAIGVVMLIKHFNSAEKAVNPVREAFVQAAGGLGELNARAAEAGVTLDHLLNAKNPEMYKTAMDELGAAFERQNASMVILDQTVQKYGFSVEELGPKWAAQKLHESAFELFQDYEVLTAGGIAHNDVIKKMAPNLQEYVDKSLAAGVAIPEQMKPVLQSMVDLGLLTDGSGEAMTDLTKLTFTQDLGAKFDTLIQTIGKLTEAITRGVGGAIAAIPTDVRVRVGYDYEAFNPPGFDGGGAGYIPMADGGDFVTTQPTLFMSSEHGLPEHVSFSGEGKNSSKDEDSSHTLVELREIRRLLKAQPRVISVALQDALVLLPKRSIA